MYRTFTYRVRSSQLWGGGFRSKPIRIPYLLQFNIDATFSVDIFSNLPFIPLGIQMSNLFFHRVFFVEKTQNPWRIFTGAASWESVGESVVKSARSPQRW